MPNLSKLKQHLGSRRTVTLHLGTLDANSMGDQLLELESEFFWRRRSERALRPSRQEEAQLRQVYRIVKKRVATGRVSPERTSSGAVIEREFTLIDGPLRFEHTKLDGDFICWQIDSYSGNWSSAKSLMVVSYAEGDICRIFCENDDQFRAEVSRLIQFVTDQAA